MLNHSQSNFSTINIGPHHQKILELFRSGGLKAGGFYPIPKLLYDVGAYDDEEIMEALMKLCENGLLSEHCAAFELTEKGVEAIEGR